MRRGNEPDCDVFDSQLTRVSDVVIREKADLWCSGNFFEAGKKEKQISQRT